MHVTIFCGHPKASLVWHQYVLYYFASLNKKRIAYFTRIDRVNMIAEKNKDCILFYKSANINALLDSPHTFQGVHVVRDPRDMLVSGYYSSRYSHPAEGHPTLLKLREKLNRVNKYAGMFLEMDYLENYFDDMSTWTNEIEGIKTIRYEDLLGNGINRKLLSHMLIQLNLDHIALDLSNAEYLFSFKSLSGGRERGQEDKKNHFRKGTYGAWKNELESDHIKEFEARWPDLRAFYYGGLDG